MINYILKITVCYFALLSLLNNIKKQSKVKQTCLTNEVTYFSYKSSLFLPYLRPCELIYERFTTERELLKKIVIGLSEKNSIQLKEIIAVEVCFHPGTLSLYDLPIQHYTILIYLVVNF